jgi:mycoredoxin
MAIIKVYGTTWCGDTKRALRIFQEQNIPYEWFDIQKDKTAEELVKEINNGFKSVPTIVFPDGSILVEPSNQVLNEKLNNFKEQT